MDDKQVDIKLKIIMNILFYVIPSNETYRLKENSNYISSLDLANELNLPVITIDIIKDYYTNMKVPYYQMNDLFKKIIKETYI